MGICRLCLKEKKLCQAHIIPNFMYRGIKDGNYVLFNKDLDESNSWTKPAQTGEFDKTILCTHCDNSILSDYEGYTKKFMFDKHNGVEQKENITVVKNINYSKFKLFLLSILWRASITNRPFFEEINLGDEHEERLRKMIYEGNALKETDYAIIMFFDMCENAEKVIQKPSYFPSIEGLEGYAFIIGHIMYWIFINSSEINMPIQFKKIMLKENGEFAFYLLPIGEFFRSLKMRSKISL